MSQLHHLAAGTERRRLLTTRSRSTRDETHATCIELARRYAEALAALRAVHDFDEWIGQYWQERCPAPESAASRDTVGAKDTIVWHEGEETVFGYLPGRDGCFCVPRDVPLPDFPFAEGTQRFRLDKTS